jgi:hypothetical protein
MARAAIINTVEQTVLHIFHLPDGSDEAVTNYRLPNGDFISPLKLGWTGSDFAIVAVVDFVPPEGKQPVGAPTFEIDGGELVETFDVVDRPPVRPMVRKSTVQARLITAGKMPAAFQALMSNPVYFARWFAPDHPQVYCDDPDALVLLAAIEADPEIIMAPEEA